MWLKRPVHFHYTPTHASWLNQIEIWFSILAKKSLDHRVGDDLGHGQIAEPFLVRRNDEPRPTRHVGGAERLLVGDDVIAPKSALAIMRFADFPVSPRIVEAVSLDSFSKSRSGRGAGPRSPCRSICAPARDEKVKTYFTLPFLPPASSACRTIRIACFFRRRGATGASPFCSGNARCRLRRPPPCRDLL
jgi:DDE superfamily endonuclease